MKQVLSSCRDKTKYHEWRHLLPRLHGEANSMCECMHTVLASVLRSSKHAHFKSAGASSISTSSELNHDFDVESLDYAIILEFDLGTQGIVSDLYGALYRNTREVQDLNQRLLERYLLVSDGLPLTSISHVDSRVVGTLCECLSTLSLKMRSIDEKLKVLCNYCDALYNTAKITNTIRHWKANYDDVSDDIQEAHAAVDAFLRHNVDAEAFLHQHLGMGGVKRARALSPPCQRKKLKAD
jgi:hypothetical protein